MAKSEDRLSILHIILAVRETSAPYNEHCLPWADRRDISICTFFGSDVATPESITLFEGDGTLPGFFRTLKRALGAKDYDVIHAHSPHVSLLFLLGTLSAFSKYAPSTVVTVHDSYQNFKLRNRMMWLPVFAAFRRVVCCGQASLESFPALYKRLAGDRLCAVQNGLDIDRVDRIAATVQERTPQAQGFTSISISRLVDIKNPFTVVDAFRQSDVPTGRTSRLVYIGDGPLRDALLEKVGEPGLENLTFTGLIPREKVFEHLLDADLFISASRGEGLPVAVMEAMACGCPVLLSDIPPHREIAEGVDFIPLVPEDDASGFAAEIDAFREMRAAERAGVGQRCRALVEERFSLQAMHAGYARVYAQLTNGRVAVSGELR